MCDALSVEIVNIGLILSNFSYYVAGHKQVASALARCRQEYKANKHEPYLMFHTQTNEFIPKFYH